MEPESAMEHLANRLVFIPTATRSAVKRNHRTRPVGTVVAVDEKWPILSVRCSGKKLLGSLVPRKPSVHRNVHPTQACSFHLFVIIVEGSEINYCLNS